MHKALLVARYEYRRFARRRAFLLGTIGFPLLLVVIAGVGVLVGLSAEGETIGYVDRAGVLAPADPRFGAPPRIPPPAPQAPAPPHGRHSQWSRPRPTDQQGPPRPRSQQEAEGSRWFPEERPAAGQTGGIRNGLPGAPYASPPAPCCSSATTFTNISSSEASASSNRSRRTSSRHASSRRTSWGSLSGARERCHAPSLPRTSITPGRSAKDPSPSTTRALPANCRRISSTLPYKTASPRLMRAIRLQSFSTWYIWWVDMITVLPAACCSSRISLTSRVLTGSRPAKGSSTMMRSGSCSSVAITCAFCCMPLESS